MNQLRQKDWICLGLLISGWITITYSIITYAPFQYVDTGLKYVVISGLMGTAMFSVGLGMVMEGSFMKEFTISIDNTISVCKVKVEAESVDDAKDIVAEMLWVGDGRYSDIHEADFDKTDQEYVII
jgi:hypothetical protein